MNMHYTEAAEAMGLRIEKISPSFPDTEEFLIEHQQSGASVLLDEKSAMKVLEFLSDIWLARTDGDELGELKGLVRKLEERVSVLERDTASDQSKSKAQTGDTPTSEELQSRAQVIGNKMVDMYDQYLYTRARTAIPGVSPRKFYFTRENALEPMRERIKKDCYVFTREEFPALVAWVERDEKTFKELNLRYGVNNRC